MSGKSSGSPALIRALRVREHARRGLGAGVVFALGMYVLSVVQSGSLQTQLLYLSLFVVLALTVGAVVTTVLVVAEIYKLLDEDR